MRAIDRPRPALAVQGLMPDLSGLGPREAVRTLARLGLVAELEGEGSVVGQSVAPGTPIGRGTVCRLWLSRTAAGAEDPGERP
jgi:cell division protein FtsI (penicillin-binding protein 3)